MCMTLKDFMARQSPFNYSWLSEDAKKLSDIPFLVKDFSEIQDQINTSVLEGKEDWYEAPQNTIWVGPYRHHLKKRKEYVENLLKIKNEIQKIDSLLDLGCGDGMNSIWLRAYTEHLYASDYNIVRLRRAQKLNLIDELVLADVVNYPAYDNSFDVIFFNHVLEHIHEDEKALAEVYRILKPGGLCILGVPNEGAFWWQLAYKFQPHSLKNSDHVQFYTSKNLSPKLANAGFKIKEIKSLGWGLPHWDLDSKVRGAKIVDDLLESIGKIIMPSQASSLYFALEK